MTAAVAGDANSDGIVNAFDQAVINANLGKTGGLAMGDVTGDGNINADDLTLSTTHFGATPVASYFGKIADYNSTLPGTSAKFFQFDHPFLSKSLNLVFWGNGGTYGIYRYSGSSIFKVADSATAAPGGTGLFESFTDPAVSGNRIVFYAQDQHASQPNGIYSAVGAGAVTSLVNRNTPAPGGGTFNFGYFGDPRVSGNTVVFPAGTAIYSMVGTTSAKVVDTNTFLPGSATNKFTGFDGVATNGTDFFFIGLGANQRGIYKKSAAALSTLIDYTTPIPGTTAKFSYITSLASDGNNLSFFGTFGGANGIFALIGSTLTKIADRNTHIPGGVGTFRSDGFGASTVGGSSVAFIGKGANGQEGIYVWNQGQLACVIDTSVTLAGKVISWFELSNTAVVSNKLTFKVNFADNTSALYVASMLAPWAPGDLNGDSICNTVDYSILWKNLGKAGTRATGDLDDDGMVTNADLQILQRHSGISYTGPLLGDVDGSGLVDSYDARMVMKNLGKHGSIAQGDFDLDGLVTIADLQIVDRQLGKTAPLYEPFGPVVAAGDVPAAGDFSSVPEPGAGMLLTLAAAFGLLRRRRADTAAN